MKVLLINGSTRKNGCTYTALTEVAAALDGDGIETEILQTGNVPIRDCAACGGCVGRGKCVYNDDIVNEWIEKAKEVDGFVFGAPVYFAHSSAQIQALMDRMFYAGGSNFMHKPAAAVISARRAGTTASLDIISKYFGIRQMPVVSSTYWNMVHGSTPEDVKKDLEGMQTMRNLGHNMAWILKCIEAGKNQGIYAPKAETGAKTNFINSL